MCKKGQLGKSFLGKISPHERSNLVILEAVALSYIIVTSWFLTHPAASLKEARTVIVHYCLGAEHVYCANFSSLCTLLVHPKASTDCAFWIAQ